MCFIIILKSFPWTSFQKTNLVTNTCNSIFGTPLVGVGIDIKCFLLQAHASPQPAAAVDERGAADEAEHQPEARRAGADDAEREPPPDVRRPASAAADADVERRAERDQQHGHGERGRDDRRLDPNQQQ